MTTHFENGLTNVSKDVTLGSFGDTDPTKYHVWFNDFDDYAAAQWIVTTTEAGSSSATEDISDADNGILLLTNDNADNDLDFLQWSATDDSAATSTFKLAAGKETWFKARFKVSDATQSDFVIGLQVIDTTPLAVTDGIFFQKDDGDALLDIYLQKDASTGLTSATGIATIVDDTYIVVGWHYDGDSTLEYFVNDVRVGSLNASSTYLPDSALTISFGIQNGEAVAKSMSIDYIFVAKTR